MPELIISERYVLRLLKYIRQDDIGSVLRHGRGAYICSYPDEQWHKKERLPVLRNYAIAKKEKMFGLLSRRSWLVSPTQCENPGVGHQTEVRHRKLLLGSRFKNKRLQQLHYTWQISVLLIRWRHAIDFILIYNFELPIFLVAFLAKWILRKRVIVDFEDDYTLVRRSGWKNVLARSCLYRLPDTVICVTEQMTRCFVGKQTLVFNGFIQLDSAAAVFEPVAGAEATFMYAGRMDDIRGVDLLPDVLRALKEAYGQVKIFVCGEGPLADTIRCWRNPAIQFHGFLPESEFLALLRKVDAFLVLQKPDHPFSRGSFPSKIEYYATMKRPIFIVGERTR